MKRLSSLFLALSFALAALPAQAATIETQNYRRALALLDAGHPEQAVLFAERGHDEILNKILLGASMAQPGNTISFNEMARFVDQEPDWPNLKGILAIAEQKLPASATPQQIIEWFKVHPPVSLVGFYRYVDALNATGNSQDAESQVHERWIKGDFTSEELTAFYARFSVWLDRDAVWARLDRLLWRHDGIHARELYPYADGGMKAVAAARLALAEQNSKAEALLSAVPRAWENDPGLLFERLHWRRKNDLDDEAIDILRHPPANLVHPEEWWNERQIMIHRVMQNHNYNLAYDLAIHHGQTEPKPLVQAEFLAGWIALRFLNDPERATEHFQKILDASSTPVSRARGDYWMGRAAEAEENRDLAAQYYSDAAVFNMTYYGQLAAARISANPVARATPEPAIPAQLRAQFYDRELVRATERLSQYNEKDRARSFFHAAMEAATQRVDFALLTELAYRIDRPDLAIETAKTANQKNMLIAAGGYPLLDQRMPQPPESALTHALIRQESMFNPEAESAVGARGLMQLMPATAKGVARKLGVRFKPQMLGNPDYNLKLGARFIQDQIDGFDGSYILAIAGYNAGPTRVREWMAQIGDPRRADVDPVDWIESIPVVETRNYVQRVIENLQIYRARLNGGQAPLQIQKDLRR